MRHARDDYNRIQDPAVSNPGLLAPGTKAIAPEEPVFLLRASDIVAPIAVRLWAQVAATHNASPKIVERALNWANEMEKWQALNTAKVPDLPPGW